MELEWTRLPGVNAMQHVRGDEILFQLAVVQKGLLRIPVDTIVG